MQNETAGLSRIVISGLRGGSGKTVLSAGIIAAWTGLGKKIAPFKKGPDYIDAGWLALAAGRPCYNLDLFLLPEEKILQSFLTRTAPGEIAVIEGNRGLFDGLDAAGSTSSAELAKILRAPVILCIDCTGASRTIAAVLLGCLNFDPALNIAGVILNRVAGVRHEKILRESIAAHSPVPIVGAVPRLGAESFPERHMGLITAAEHGGAEKSIAEAARIAGTYLDLDALARIAERAASVPLPANRIDVRPPSSPPDKTDPSEPPPRIGVLRDSAFQFYYPENIDALIAAGAEVEFLSPLSGAEIPDIDGMYIGGGFPETHAEKLAANIGFREALRSRAERGLPVYAECGGLIYLGKELNLGENKYPMAGVLPIVFGFSQRPQGHGYTVFKVEGENPYFRAGEEIRGHEFHYSRVLEWGGNDSDLVFRMKRGLGISGNRDGARFKNVLATYTHIHALGVPDWGNRVVARARAFRREKAGRSG